MIVFAGGAQASRLKVRTFVPNRIGSPELVSRSPNSARRRQWSTGAKQKSCVNILQFKSCTCFKIDFIKLISKAKLCCFQGEAGDAGGRRFAVAVTGDHSTPAIYGDHSHEPVPFAIAHVRHAVRRRDPVWMLPSSAFVQPDPQLRCLVYIYNACKLCTLCTDRRCLA